MALKILETPPDTEGCVLECGTWNGGSAANLSLVCRVVGRRLKIYDSFEGLPAGAEGDREAAFYKEGDYGCPIDVVRKNITAHGAIECCDFIEGWFDATLPELDDPVLLVFIDVDLEASLETCIRYTWPHLVDTGYVFIDESVGTDYCALFYSERYWKETFGRCPPGLIGAGTGLALGEFYIGPYSEMEAHPTWRPTTGAFTRKDMSGTWTYFPPREDTPAQQT